MLSNDLTTENRGEQDNVLSSDSSCNVVKKNNGNDESNMQTKANRKIYSIWRFKIMCGILLGYGGLYIIRETMPLATLAIEEAFNISRKQMGLVTGAFFLSYTFGKFFNGVLSDKVSPRKLFTFAILSSAVSGALIMSLANSFYVLVFSWGFCGWFQSMGWPACARLISRWYAKEERGAKWGIASTSHMIAAGTVAAVFPYIMKPYGWRSGFSVAAVICILIAIIIYSLIRRSPRSLNLPSPESYIGVPERTKDREHDDSDSIGYLEAFKIVLRNKDIWFISCAICFLYIVRVGFQAWGPVFLQEARNMTLIDAGWYVSVFCYSGAVGGITAGYISDRMFNGYRTPVIIMYTFIIIVSLIAFYNIKEPNMWSLICFAMLGFGIFGPQVLISVASIDYADSRVTSTANGVVGAASAFGSTIATAGIGSMQDIFGWNVVLMFFVSCTVIMATAIIFVSKPKG